MTSARCIAAVALLVAACAPTPSQHTAEAPVPQAATKAPAPKPAPKVATPPAAPAKVAPTSAARTAPASPPAPTSPLDLKSLEQRLKDTGAIGVLTKLSLKNQVDDLVARFRAFHQGNRPPTLAELRPSYELLLMKVLSLLQDRDTALAKDINASRDALWGVLADRDKFSKIQ